uniref:Uncharacterized protein n=1 Tax=Picea glauca TaxID=3330 RepID=A0A124GMF9_PICGL|nr:hypothetical protein ABT39_MTgene2381 [Picea glauca]
MSSCRGYVLPSFARLTGYRLRSCLTYRYRELVNVTTNVLAIGPGVPWPLYRQD